MQILCTDGSIVEVRATKDARIPAGIRYGYRVPPVEKVDLLRPTGGQNYIVGAGKLAWYATLRGDILEIEG